ncbi:chloroplast envelope quinone oxidoreductase homolog isoform X1 [Salvia splendens]|uniref:chloroplast envelope quinone oxidoreductase homolog isoform X1 n=1 Tax=Salvia splendens TaxID=180675 RepID=UPI001C278F25|nr:chloroplast envelope quinone oxidoreductase homolog isoform X1 [Salvia splendens]
MAEKLMCAVQYDSYGGGAAGLKQVEVPVPTPSKGEVLLKLEATTLNPIDWKIQKGLFRPLMPKRFPYIPATDVAGEVVEVGPGVENFKPGDKIDGGGSCSILHLFYGFSLIVVMNILDKKKQTGGGLAEYAVAKIDMTVHRPAEISAAEGASFPIAGLTAHGALTLAGLKFDGPDPGPQKNILVTAASGGVGHFAVQLAKLGNAHVTATCGVRNIDLVRSLGADEVLDYKTPAGAVLKSPSGKKYDAVIQCASAIPWSVFEPNLNSTGKVIDLTPGTSAMWTYAVKKLTLSKKQLVPFMNSVKAENLVYLAELVKQGNLKVVIDCKHALNDAEAAWAKSIDGHATGKIVVEP